MMKNLNAITLFLVHDYQTKKYRFIVPDGNVRGQLGEDEMLVYELDYDQLISFVNMIKLEHGNDSKITILGDEYDCSPIIYFEITNNRTIRKNPIW